MRWHLALILAAFALVSANPVDAQRGRPGGKPPCCKPPPPPPQPPHRNLKVRTAAWQSLAQIRQLAPTPENFSRSQVALAVLTAGEFTLVPPVNTTIDATSLTDASKGLKFFAALAKEEPDGSLKFTKIPPRVRILDAVPSNQSQFRSRFGRPMSAVDQTDIENGKALINASGAPVSTNFTHLFSQAEKIAVIIGHNEHGRIVLQNNMSMRISETSRGCSIARIICIFVVCDSHDIVGADAIGLTSRINYRRASRLAVDLASIASHASVGPDGMARLPLALVHQILQRVEREGGTIRIVGYRVGEWFVVRLIEISPSCDARSDC